MSYAADFPQIFKLVVHLFFTTKGPLKLKMYKKVYMKFPYIYDTAFCNDFGNIKKN